MNTALHGATQGLGFRNTPFKIACVLQARVRGRCLYVVYNLMCLIKKKKICLLFSTCRLYSERNISCESDINEVFGNKCSSVYASASGAHCDEAGRVRAGSLLLDPKAWGAEQEEQRDVSHSHCSTHTLGSWRGHFGRACSLFLAPSILSAPIPPSSRGPPLPHPHAKPPLQPVPHCSSATWAAVLPVPVSGRG